MATIGFNFTKMLVERKAAASGKITVSYNLMPTTVTHKNSVTGSNNVLGFGFKFDLKYTPDIGSVSLEGNVMELVSEQELKENLALMKDKKQPTKEVLGRVMQYALRKCQIQGIILANEMNLPSPIPLPTSNKGDAKIAPSTSAPAAQAPKGKK